MSEFKESFDYTLKTPIKIHTKEGMEDFAQELTIKAPGPQNHVEYNLLDSTFTRALLHSSKLFKSFEGTTSTQGDMFEEETEETKANQITTILKASLDAEDIMKCYNVLPILLTSGSAQNAICTLDGVKLTRPMYDKIGLKDREHLLGLYFGNFIAGSLLS